MFIKKSHLFFSTGSIKEDLDKTFCFMEKSKIEEKKYVAWKTDNNINPIQGSERILSGISQRAIIRHLAFEEKVIYNNNDLFVKNNDGTKWFVSKL